jgi:DNA-binding GntR family transcriptional regulator
MAQDAARELRELIVLGTIPPGETLPLEDVARMLGMSISPVREAIRQLEMMGLVEHVPYRGARVTPLEPSDMHDVYEARSALEALAVRRAALRFGDENEHLLLAALASIERGYEDDDHGTIVAANTTFHTELAAASGSWWLRRLIAPTLESTERFSAALLGVARSAHAQPIEEAGHRAILDALREHDQDASEAALRSHLRGFEELFLSQMSEPQPVVAATARENRT